MQRTLRAAAILLFLAAAAAQADEWADLMRGNARYVAGHLVYSHLRSQRRTHRTQQHPPVTIVSCADSRVPPELMFDQTIGDIFVVRVAGNVIDTFNLASLEYAVSHGWTKLIVVIGHQECGAVKAALTGHGGTPALDALVHKIEENLDHETPPLKEAIEKNARASAKQITEESELIRREVDAGKVKIVTAYYDFNGRVRRLN
jgi:carbonic anhydrase